MVEQILKVVPPLLFEVVLRTPLLHYEQKLRGLGSFTPMLGTVPFLKPPRVLRRERGP
jgi:hypothetical protein